MMNKPEEKQPLVRDFSRYLVAKVSDVEKALQPGQVARLLGLLDVVADYREKVRGVVPLECVVVESDWPEYEKVWRMIADRVLGVDETTADNQASADSGVRVFMDGDQWCVLLGADLQEGTGGFGATPAEALLDFAANWKTKHAADALQVADQPVLTLRAAGYRDMGSAPKDGTAILAKLNGSDAPYTIRWVVAKGPWQKKTPGWEMVWDGYRLKDHDMPTCWIPVPGE